MAKLEIACVAVVSNEATKNSEIGCSFCGLVGRLKRGFCDRHYRAFMRNGDPAIIQAKQQKAPCNWIGCDQPVRACGFCRAHYLQAQKEGRLEEGKYLRDHPLYSLWWARRKADALSAEWRDDLQRFIADVGDRPGEFFNLVTLRDGPFGPDNFHWREQLKRRPSESKRAFYARKWQAQNVARPSWQQVRDLKRKYNLSSEIYHRMLSEQKGLCAICSKAETKIDHRVGTAKRLCVDHCHLTGAVRGLLCSACNVTIGQINESIDTLRAMIAYLERHSQPKENHP